MAHTSKMKIPRNILLSWLESKSITPMVESPLSMPSSFLVPQAMNTSYSSSPMQWTNHCQRMRHSKRSSKSTKLNSNWTSACESAKSESISRRSESAYGAIRLRGTR
jgi:L-lactate utilization protein LutC